MFTNPRFYEKAALLGIGAGSTWAAFIIISFAIKLLRSFSENPWYPEPAIAIADIPWSVGYLIQSIITTLTCVAVCIGIAQYLRISRSTKPTRAIDEPTLRSRSSTISHEFQSEPESWQDRVE